MNTEEAVLKANQGSLKIKIVGLGGAGTNAIEGLELEGFESVQFAALNTDAQALGRSRVAEKLVIGRSITRGLGTGADVELGQAAAETDRDAIEKLIGHVDLLILVVGLGGGTGSAAANVVAEVAARTDALVLAFATLPFSFEGARTKRIADSSIGELRQRVHGLIPLPNDALLQEGDEDATVVNAFAVADRWISRGIHSLCSMLLKTGLINQDFGSLRSVFQGRGGKTLFGTGVGSGAGYVTAALEDLYICPLLHLNDRPAHLDRTLVNVIGGTDLSMSKLNEIMQKVSHFFGSREDIIFGAFIDEARRESIEICVLAKAEVDSGLLLPPEPVELPRQTVRTSLGLETEISQDTRAPRRVHPSKLRRKQQPEAEQDEFTFIEVDAQRGYFEKTDRNEYKDEDLDVPTYLRKGIKIKIK